MPYTISLQYKKWQNKLKNEFEEQKQLSISQSVEIRLMYKKQQEKFEKIISEKEEVNTRLKDELKKYEDEINQED